MTKEIQEELRNVKDCESVKATTNVKMIEALYKGTGNRTCLRSFQICHPFVYVLYKLLSIVFLYNHIKGCIIFSNELHR